MELNKSIEALSTRRALALGEVITDRCIFHTDQRDEMYTTAFEDHPELGLLADTIIETIHERFPQSPRYRQGVEDGIRTLVAAIGQNTKLEEMANLGIEPLDHPA